MHYETALKHNELQTAQLRKTFDDNRSTLLEYLAQEFEEKLQWEENECYSKLRAEMTAEELQRDELVTDLIDQNAEVQNAELQAEANSLRTGVRRKETKPNANWSPHCSWYWRDG